MSAPERRTSSKVTPFTVACVPTGMKAGVAIVPRGVDISPRRAAPSVASRWKEKGSVIISQRHCRGAAISAFTRVFDALWRRTRNPSFSTGIMDSGFAPAARPGMTAYLNNRHASP